MRLTFILLGDEIFIKKHGFFQIEQRITPGLVWNF